MKVWIDKWGRSRDGTSPEAAGADRRIADATVHARLAEGQLRRLGESSAEGLAIAKQIALAKWDSDAYRNRGLRGTGYRRRRQSRRVVGPNSYET